MAKRKRCKLKSCNKLFVPQYTSLQATCSAKCALEYSRERKAINAAELNAIRNEKSSLDSLSKALDQTRILVNTYIRLRDHGKVCISCSTILASGYDAGHIWSAATHSLIRFEYDVIHGQCVKCNRYMEGNYDFARQKARLRLGDDRYNQLEKRAELARRIPHTWTRHELKEIRDLTRKKIVKLKQQR